MTDYQIGRKAFRLALADVLGSLDEAWRWVGEGDLQGAREVLIEMALQCDDALVALDLMWHGLGKGVDSA